MSYRLQEILVCLYGYKKSNSVNKHLNMLGLHLNFDTLINKKL